MLSVKDLLDHIYHSAGFADSIVPKLFPTSISEKEGLFLTKIIQKNRPTTLVELGFGYGVSALWISAAKHQPKQHIIVDPFRMRANKDLIYQTVKKQRNVTFEEKKTSQEFLAEFARTKKTAEMVFMDADNRFDAFMADMYFVSRVVPDNGVVIVRNIWNPSIRKGVIFVLRNLPFTLPQLDPKDLELLRKTPFWAEILLRRFLFPSDFCILKKTGPDLRPWDDFVHF